MNANVDDLITVLEWCCNKERWIINLSLGSYFQRDFWKLRRIINMLILKQSLVVAACNNNGYFSSPANMMGVIGVKAFNGLNAFHNDKMIIRGEIIFAPGEFCLDNIGSVKNANSYAAAYVTAKISEAEDNKDIFKKYINRMKSFSLFPDFLNNTIIVSSSFEEIYEELLFFDNKRKVEYVKDVYESEEKVCILLGEDFKEDYINLITNKHNIYGIVCMGHVDVNTTQYIREKKHLFLWTLEEYRSYIKKCFCFWKTRDILIPVICINETKKNENIYLSKCLQKLLAESGYNVALSSSKSVMLLYGFFYNPNVEWKRYLSYLQWYLNLDVIIVCDEINKTEGELGDVNIDIIQKKMEVDGKTIDLPKDVWNDYYKISLNIIDLLIDES